MCLVNNNKSPVEIEKIYKKFVKSTYNPKKKKAESQLDLNSLMNSYKNNMNVLKSVMDYVDSDSASTFRNIESNETNTVVSGKRPFPGSELHFEDHLMHKASKKAKKNPKRKEFSKFIDSDHFNGEEIPEGGLNMNFLAHNQPYNAYIDFYDAYGRGDQLFNSHHHHPQVRFENGAKLSPYLTAHHPPGPMNMLTNYPNNPGNESPSNMQALKSFYNGQMENYHPGGNNSPYISAENNGIYLTGMSPDGRQITSSNNNNNNNTLSNIFSGINHNFPIDHHQKTEENGFMINSPRSDFGLSMRRKNSLFETSSTGKWSDDENFKMEIFDEQNHLSPNPAADVGGGSNKPSGANNRK